METIAEVGPVEFLVARLDGEHVSARLLEALLDEVETQCVRVLDVVVVHRRSAGELELDEVEPGEYRLAGLELGAHGLATREDLDALCASVPVGASAVVLLVELLWERRLVGGMDRGGGRVVVRAHVSAAVANACLAAARAR